MRSTYCVCVCQSPPINFWMPEPTLMKLGTYKYILVCHGNWAHLNGVFHKFLRSICMTLCISLLLLGNGYIKSYRGNKYTLLFLCGPYRINGKQANSLSKISCFLIWYWRLWDIFTVLKAVLRNQRLSERTYLAIRLWTWTLLGITIVFIYYYNRKQKQLNLNVYRAT